MVYASRLERRSGRRLRRDVVDTFFQATPVQDPDAPLRSLTETLIPAALHACRAHSPWLASVLEHLIALVMSSRSSCASYAVALYVILKTSLISSPPLLIPRLLLTPQCVRIAESIRLHDMAHSSALGWSGERDPIIAAMATWGSLGSFASTTRESNVSGLTKYGNGHGTSTSNHWNVSLTPPDPLDADDAWLQRYNERQQSQLHTSFTQPISVPTTYRLRTATDLLSSSHKFFRLARQSTELDCAQPLSGVEGMFLAAIHYAMSGCADPYGLVSRQGKFMGRSGLSETMSVHPSLLTSNSGGPAARLGVRGVVGMLQQGVEWGNMMTALTSIVKRAGSVEASAAVGSIGVAAIRGLSQQLHTVRLALATSLSTCAQRIMSLTSSDVLHVWFSRLVPITHVIMMLGDIFRVNCHDANWTESASLSECSSIAFLNRLYGFIASQSAHEALPLAQTLSLSSARTATPEPTSSLSILHIASSIFHCAVSPFFELLHRWLATGDLVGADVYDEFFIVPSYGETDSGYRLVPDRIPCFVSKLAAELFLAAGEARAVLFDSLKRQWSADGTQHEHSRGLRDALERFDAAAPKIALDGASPNHRCVQWEEYLESCLLPVRPMVAWPQPQRAGGRMNDSPSESDDDEQNHIIDVDTASSHGAEVGSQPEDAPSPMSLKSDSMARFGSIQDTEGWGLHSSKASDAGAELEQWKQKAADVIRAEHEAKMNILRHQQAIVQWKTRRIGLKFARRAALRDEVEMIQETYARCVPQDWDDDERKTPIGFFVRPLQDYVPTPSYEMESAEREREENLLPPVTRALDITNEFVEDSSHTDGDAGPSTSVEVLQGPQGSLFDDSVVLGLGDDDDDSVFNTRSDPQHTERDTMMYAGEASGATNANAGVPAMTEVDVYAHVALNDEELEEMYGIGVTSQHFNVKRARIAAAAYDRNEDIMKKVGLPTSLADMETYLAECRVGAASEAFVNESHWANSMDLDDDITSLTDAVVHRSRPLHNHGTKQEETGVVPYTKYLNDLSHCVSSFFVHQTLRLLLHPIHGVTRKLFGAMQSVCLLQGSSFMFPVLVEWEQRAFGSLSDATIAPMDAVAQAMVSGFDALWNKAWGGHASQCPLPLQLSANMSPSTTVRGPFDLLPLLCVSSSPHQTVNVSALAPPDSFELLLPQHAVRRYSDLFVSLIFWRWTQRLLDLTWSRGVAKRSTKHHHKAIWYFTTLARNVLVAVMEHIWHRLSSVCRAFDNDLGDMTWLLSMGSLHQCIERHDAFLREAFDGTLLGPQFARARKQLRTMVKLVESVHHFLSCAPTAGDDSHLHKVHEGQLLQRVEELWSAATALVDHLSEIVSAAPADFSERRSLLQLISSIEATLASCHSFS